MTFARRLGCTVLVFSLVFSIGRPASAYLKFGFSVNGQIVTVKWQDLPVRYFVNDSIVGGISSAAFADALGRAFTSWEAVPSAAIRYQFGGFTSSVPGEDDGRTTIGFLEAPELDRVLASTSLLIDEISGELLEADIFFNSAFPWSTSAAGEPGRFDVETIALHEIGHLNGLGHSAIGETEVSGGGRTVLATAATMFPLAFGPGNVLHRALHADDIAGISDLYPDTAFDGGTGSLSGRVTKNGQGLFGAHVVAFHPATGALVGNFALNGNGAFAIAGLAPGPYVLRVEPLDDADVDSFFEVDAPLDLNFRVAFHDKVVVVPRAGDNSTGEVKVLPK